MDTIVFGKSLLADVTRCHCRLGVCSHIFRNGPFLVLEVLIRGDSCDTSEGSLDSCYSELAIISIEINDRLSYRSPSFMQLVRY